MCFSDHRFLPHMSSITSITASESIFFFLSLIVRDDEVSGKIWVFFFFKQMYGKIKTDFSAHSCLSHRRSMIQLKPVTVYRKTLKRNLLGVLGLFFSHERMEHSIKIGQCFITFFNGIYPFHSNFQNSQRMLSLVCKFTTAYSPPT